MRRTRAAAAEGSRLPLSFLLRPRNDLILLPLFHSSLLLILSHLAEFLPLLDFLPRCFLRLPVLEASSSLLHDLWLGIFRLVGFLPIQTNQRRGSLQVAGEVQNPLVAVVASQILAVPEAGQSHFLVFLSIHLHRKNQSLQPLNRPQGTFSRVRRSFNGYLMKNVDVFPRTLKLETSSAAA